MSAATTIASCRSVNRVESRSENLPMGFMGGLAAAIASAGLWALITIVLGYQAACMAIGVGFLVGLSVRLAGKGTHRAFGIMGAVLACGACVAGNALTVVVIAARQFEVALPEALISLTPASLYGLMATSFRPTHLFFYFVAVWEGYRFSIIGHA